MILCEALLSLEIQQKHLTQKKERKEKKEKNLVKNFLKNAR